MTRTGVIPVHDSRRRSWTGGLPVVTVLAALALWQGASAIGILPTNAFPSMTETAFALVGLLASPTFYVALGQTVVGWALGVLIAIAIAIPVGTLLGRLPSVFTAVRLPVDFLRTIPSIAVLPLIALLLGPTMQMKIALVVYGAFWPLLLQTIAGVRDTDAVLTETAASYRFNGWVRFRHVLMPSALPYIMTGLRIATVVGLVLAISGEFLGAAPGLGFQMGLAQSGGDLPLTYAYVVLVGLVGVLANVLLDLSGKRILRWHPSVRGDIR